jgi:hypothetical protein
MVGNVEWLKRIAFNYGFEAKFWFVAVSSNWHWRILGATVG